MVSTGCCATLDNIITYLFRRLINKKKQLPNHVPDGEAILSLLEARPEILQQVGTVLYVGNKLEWPEGVLFVWGLLKSIQS